MSHNYTNPDTNPNTLTTLTLTITNPHDAVKAFVCRYFVTLYGTNRDLRRLHSHFNFLKYFKPDYIRLCCPNFLTPWAAEESILEAGAAPVCGLKTVHFKTLNKFNALLELAFEFIFQKIREVCLLLHFVYTNCKPLASLSKPLETSPRSNSTDLMDPDSTPIHKSDHFCPNFKNITYVLLKEHHDSV